MVRAVDASRTPPQRARLPGRRTGGSSARSPASWPASASTTPAGAASASASAPRASTTPRRSSIPRFAPVHEFALTGLPVQGAGLERRALRGDDGLRQRATPTSARAAASRPDDDRRHANREAARPARAVRREQGRQALRRGRLQLLGRDLRPGLGPLLRDPGDRRPPLPGRGQRPRPQHAGPARRRRVPLALARRQADRLQEPDRRQDPLAAEGARPGDAERPRRRRARARSTTRSSGSTTTPSSTPTGSTSSRSPPAEAAARRGC